MRCLSCNPSCARPARVLSNFDSSGGASANRRRAHAVEVALIRLANVQSGLRLVLLLPSLWGQIREMWRADPGAPRP